MNLAICHKLPCEISNPVYSSSVHGFSNDTMKLLKARERYFIVLAIESLLYFRLMIGTDIRR